QAIADPPVGESAANRIRIRVSAQENDVRFVGCLGEHLLEPLSPSQSALLSVGHCLRVVHAVNRTSRTFARAQLARLCRITHLARHSFTTGWAGWEIAAPEQAGRLGVRPPAGPKSVRQPLISFDLPGSSRETLLRVRTRDADFLRSDGRALLGRMLERADFARSTSRDPPPPGRGGGQLSFGSDPNSRAPRPQRSRGFFFCPLFAASPLPQLACFWPET